MKKMSFDEFVEEVVGKVKEYLPETFSEASIELMHVVKNNDLELTGLIIQKAANSICPTIYLESFFEDYQSGEDMRDVIRRIAEIRVKNEKSNTFDVRSIMNYESVKDKIVPRLIGKEQNKRLLENQPHKIIADLAITYHILLSNEEGRTASAPITNALMETWGVKIEDIHDLSIKNMRSTLSSTFRGISSVLSRAYFGKEIEIDPADEIMFVLSNNKSTYGASAVLDDRIMRKMVDRFGEDFYILPSSVHEVLIVPETPEIDVKQLKEMVGKINLSSVPPEDRLSDNVYRYTVKDGLHLAR